MRYFLISLALLVVFAVPAFAATSGTADVTVTIGTVNEITVDDDWSLTVDDCDDYTNGVWTTGGPVDVYGCANYTWEITAAHDGWVDSDWTLYLSTDSGSNWTQVTDTASDWIDNQAANSFDYDVDAKVTGIDYADSGDSVTVTFTIKAED